MLPSDKTFGQAKSVIFLFLQGGPPQHETFDPKPDAPVEIRGPFKPISTTVPGVQFCELLPRTARIAHKLAVVRSMATDDNNHDSSGYWVQTGYKYQGPNSRTIQPTDWPYFGSIVKQLKPSDVLPPLSSVWIPDIMRLNESVTPAGQTAGILGRQWDPDVFVGDPSAANYKVEGLRLSDIPPLRLQQRESLLRQVERHFSQAERSESVRIYDKFQQQALDLLTSNRAREAFALEKEPDKVRDRYGRSPWGQCVLLARRLVEAGVRLVHVSWPREPGDNAVDNPLWDTHAQNFDRVEDVLCPQFDVGFTALIDDLESRGLLGETLVVAIGEFGRTPQVNANGGRDHWGPVFSFALAGAGISAGQVYGASDKNGAYPARDRVQGGDLTATIFHLLGIPPQSTFRDREGREHPLTLGHPLYPLLGLEEATSERSRPGGDVARVPPYDQSLLLNTDFQAPLPLLPAEGDSRPKGWRAAPLVSAQSGDNLAAQLVAAAAAPATVAKQHVAIGFGLAAGTGAFKIDHGATVLLAQEVRSPFAGTYHWRVHLRGEASSRELFENVLLKHFTCRLQFFSFLDKVKRSTDRKELASVTFQPRFFAPDEAGSETFELAKEFINPSPGQNYSFGPGLGVAILLEKTSEGVLELPATGLPQRALLRITGVQIEFAGKERNKDVRV